MSIETVETIMFIPPHWKIGKMFEGRVCVDIEGCRPEEIPLSHFADGALRQLRAILMGKVHALVIERASVYKHIAEVNGELDRRVNEAACKSTPYTPASGG